MSSGRAQSVSTSGSEDDHRNPNSFGVFVVSWHENETANDEGISPEQMKEIRKVQALASCPFTVAAACYTASGGNLEKAIQSAKKQWPNIPFGNAKDTMKLSKATLDRVFRRGEDEASYSDFLKWHKEATAWLRAGESLAPPSEKFFEHWKQSTAQRKAAEQAHNDDPMLRDGSSSAYGSLTAKEELAALKVAAERIAREKKNSEGRSIPPEKWTPETARRRVGGTLGSDCKAPKSLMDRMFARKGVKDGGSEYAVIDTARGGKVLKVFATREEAVADAERRNTPADPNRYRVSTRAKDSVKDGGPGSGPKGGQPGFGHGAKTAQGKETAKYFAAQVKAGKNVDPRTKHEFGIKDRAKDMKFSRKALDRMFGRGDTKAA